VIRALAQRAGDVPVTQLMHRAPVRVQADQSLDQVRQAMSEHTARVAAVYEGDHYLGLVSAEDIAEAFALLKYFDNNAAEPEETGKEIVV
jgi:predicted transcriptional regulator